jgi:hypothetical protein
LLTRASPENVIGGFRFLLVFPDGDPADPALFNTIIPTWAAGGVVLLAVAASLGAFERSTRRDDDAAVQAQYPNGKLGYFSARSSPRSDPSSSYWPGFPLAT